MYFSSDIRVVKCLSEKHYAHNISRLTKGIVCGYKSLYKNPTETFFKNIFQIPQSSYVEIKNDLEFKTKKYWKVEKINNNFKNDLELIDQDY